ncbi:MAG: PEGA domain-containing protein, partial [Myxococcota bacterium]
AGPGGTVVIDARQPAEVYVDGKFVAATPATRALSEGTHTVTLVAADGRRRIFEVRITAGAQLHKTWDFDRMEWR